MNTVLEKFAEAAQRPYEHVKAWKQEHGIRAVGTLPMHFPAEIIHATGALPVIVQEMPDAITSGGGAMYPFFCGYTRSIVDQVTEDQLGFLDAIMFTDHCVQLLSAADVIRISRPETTIHFHQLIASIRQPWSLESSVKTLRELVADLEEVLGVVVTEDALRHSIGLFNENRRLIRELYQMRRTGRVQLRASQMQHIVKSSMVMDKETHNALLRELIAALTAPNAPRSDKIAIFVSGHLCHAPRPEILDLIEDCGAMIVDDDLYTGFRYVSTDVDAGIGDPIVALATAYIRKNDNVPCPTRIDPDVDWEDWLLGAVDRCGAQGLIVLLVKFCEPHYFAYPRIKAAFERNDVPQLMIETEHDGVAMENVRTKVESFVEMIKVQSAARAVAA